MKPADARPRVVVVNLGWAWHVAAGGVALVFATAVGVLVHPGLAFALLGCVLLKLIRVDPRESWQLWAMPTGVVVMRDGVVVPLRGWWMVDAWVVLETRERVVLIRSGSVDDPDFARLRRALKAQRRSATG